MIDIFHIEITEVRVLIYLDDILIFHKDLEEHHQAVRQVLHRLREHKLYLKPEKCEFDQLETEYLGVVVSKGEVRMDPVKVAGITEWPTPVCKRDVQSFLRFCNFYRRFIHHFADIAHPLHGLTGNVSFQWTPECGEAFDKLKLLLTSGPILVIPNNNDKFQLECDASAYALGAVLSQQQESKW
jgi:trans-aconitate methyltransferase